MNFFINFVYDFFWPVLICSIVFLLIMIIAGFRIFEKANIDGYKILIPIYNLYLLLQIAELPIFLIPLFFIPFVNVLVFWLLSFFLGKQFDKKMGFRIGMCFLPILFYPVLAFSNSLYKAEEEVGMIRPQDQNSTMYNQFPDVEEVVSGQGANPLGVADVENDMILEIDNDTTWQDQDRSVTIDKKVVTIDEMDDPLLNPDAKPIKVGNLDQFKICPNCGSRLGIDAEVCFLCGAPIEESQESV